MHKNSGHICRTILLLALAVVGPFSLTGCYALAAGIVVGIVALSDDGGGGGGSDQPPIVSRVAGPAFFETPDEVRLFFVVENDDGGLLRARVEYVDVAESTFARPRDVPAEMRTQATPTSESDDLVGLESGKLIRFRWNAGQDLGGGSTTVQMIITPMEDGVEGSAVLTDPVRAGNTPVEVDQESLFLGSAGDTLFVQFRLFDAEADQIRLERLEIALKGIPFKAFDFDVGSVPFDAGDFVCLPQREEEFSSRPKEDGGGVASLTLGLSSLADLTEEELSLCGGEVTEEQRAKVLEVAAEAGRAGFVGALKLRISLRDFATEELVVIEFPEPFLFDNNEPPSVEIVSIGDMQPTSGVIPIRYRLFDDELNPADVLLDVNLGDGQGFRTANEFPTPRSEGRQGLCTLDRLARMDPGGCTKPDQVLTFLWDAASQSFGVLGNVTMQVSPRDRESARGSTQTFGPVSGGGLERVGEIDVGRLPLALVSGDFDGDGFADVVVANTLSGDVTYLRGGVGGLGLAEKIAAGRGPAALASGDFNADGFPDVVVANELSANVTYLRGGPGGLERVGEIEVGDFPVALVSGEFDGAGFTGVVVANSHSDNVTYLRGGAGGLERVGEIEVGDFPVALMSGDFDGDGFPDVVVANRSSDNVTCLRGGAGGLARVGEIDVGDGPSALVSVDFNGDGFPDALVANQGDVVDPTPDNVTYLRGGTGGLERVAEIDAGDDPRALVSGDFDGDRFPDVAVANESSDNVTHLRGGAGGLARVGEIDVGDGPSALVSEDFDGDGFADVVVANRDSDDVTYLRGAAGGLERVGEIDVGRGPSVLVSGDFDGDGFPDVVVANRDSDNVTYLRASARGLARVEESKAGVQPRALVSGDFDGDGFADVVATNEGSDNMTYLRGGAGGLERVGDIEASRGPFAIVSGDFDGNDFSDVVVANQRSDDVTYLRGSPGGLEQVGEIDAGDLPIALASGDFDGDGFADVVVANSRSDNVTYLRGAAGGLERVGEIDAGNGPLALVSEDFDGDGFSDVVVANERSDNVTYLRGGAGGLVRVGRIAAGDGPQALASGDFDGDGFADVVVTNGSSDNVTCLRGGAGGLERLREIDVGDGPSALVSGDFNGDGFSDALVANRGAVVDPTPDNVTYLRGGTGGLERVAEIDAGDDPRALVSGDFDGDGFADVVVASGFSRTVTYLRGGAGGLERLREIRTGDGPRALASGDVDGDGFADVVSANFVSNDVSYLRQRFLLGHANHFFDPEKPLQLPSIIQEPRNPPRYKLELPEAPFAAPTQVCLVPGPIFELPQAEVFGRDRFLVNVTLPVSLLRESTEIQGEAWLTLRLRDHDPDLLDEVMLHPENLRVLRKDSDTGVGVNQQVNVGLVEFDDSRPDNPAVRFSITRFGSYVVALERERP